MSGEGKLVCVTGASGYIASWVVKLLLLRGYSVNATVRHLNDPKKVEHLMDLEGAKERLKLFRAELTEEGSFDSAVAGCVGVFHTASPCFLLSDDPQNWYALSKILAEEAAWQYAKEKGIDLVTICPGCVMGPMLQPSMNSSSSFIFSLIGAETYLDIAYGYVHVKDVADAHIRAFEIESANGRYCIVEREVHFSEVVSIMRDAFPSLPLPNKCVSGEAYMPECKYSRQRADSLGIEFIPFEVTLKEMMQSFKEKKFITI